MTDYEDAIAERTEARADLFRAQERVRELEGQNARLLDLNFGFMGQNRKLREENARLKGFAEAVVENFDCDCEEMDMKRDGVCFWCQAKEALIHLSTEALKIATRRAGRTT